MTRDEVIERFIDPQRLYTRAEVFARPSPIAAGAGVYGWWFRTAPPRIDPSRCLVRDGLALLFVGISPTAPPANGKPQSHQGLRSRVRYHCAGNAEGSTLRETLGCLLADELGLELRRVGSGRRMTFVLGEPRLSAWMAENSLVSWVACERSWEVEETLIAALDLPLNLKGNGGHPFHAELSQIRSAAEHRAAALPTLANPGIGGAGAW